jgi:tRNA modification GTPase
LQPSERDPFKNSSMIDFKNDTIAAVSTPPGEGGISIIRVSGPNAITSLMDIFQTRLPIPNLQNRYMTLGRIKDGIENVDDVLVTYFKKPNSYTGDESVEINCHGSPLVCKRVLDLLFQHGVRAAQPGEFTLRAFLNGKMDLTQAEAVADLIHSKTEESRKAAFNQLNGNLSKRIQHVREELIHACSLLEIELDFSEEEIEFTPKEELADLLKKIRNDIEALLNSYERGRICRDGIRIVLTGKPNVGKSSILNCLLEKERAIVTAIPGTTRDIVEDILDIGGFLAYLSDTAGMRRTEDTIEKEGILRTEQAIEHADLILCIFDKSVPFDHEDENLNSIIKKLNKKTFTLINKIDLPAAWETQKMIQNFPSRTVFEISALKSTGIQSLIQSLESTIHSGGSRVNGEATLTNTRHRNCLIKSKEDIIKAQVALFNKMSQEFIAMDLRVALDHLGEITGQTGGEEILNEIFSSFCIGK